MPYRWASPARYKIQRGHRAHAGETGLHNAHFVFVSPTRSTQVRIPVAEICGRTIPWSQQCLSILDVAKLADIREVCTVAILAQGTSRAVAVTQAFSFFGAGSNPAGSKTCPSLSHHWRCAPVCGRARVHEGMDFWRTPFVVVSFFVPPPVRSPRLPRRSCAKGSGK